MIVASDRVLVDAPSIQADLARLAQEIAEDLSGPENVLVVGIHHQGVRIGAHLQRLLENIWGTEISGGTLDIGLHRDDLDSKPVPRLRPTMLPLTIRDQTVILVDDVIHTGRTIRAALDSLHDFGRPRRVLLVALFDRGQRCLPIAPDYIGRKIDLKGDERVQVVALENPGCFEARIDGA